jgi:hypothetical protein
MTLLTDPRTHPKIRQVLQALGGGPTATEHPEEWSIESLTPSIAASHAAVTGLYEMLENDLPTDADEPAVDISEQTIKGVDGNDIKVWVYKPASAKESLPAVFYFHGGGMVSWLPFDLSPQDFRNVIVMGLRSDRCYRSIFQQPAKSIDAGHSPSPPKA